MYMEDKRIFRVQEREGYRNMLREEEREREVQYKFHMGVNILI